MKRERRIWRGVVLGLALLPANGLWVLFMESFTWKGPFVSTISLFLNVVLLLLVISLLNRAVRRVRPGLALNQAEMVTLYVILATGTAIVGHDMLQVLISVMIAGAWIVAQQPHALATLAHSFEAIVPQWLVVSDPQALYGFYSGDSTLYQRSVLAAWVAPLLWWAAFAVVMVVVMICLAALLRPLWADRERLTFPIIQLPLELTDPNTSLFRQRLFWLGLVAAGGVDLLNGLSHIYPAVPGVTMYVNLGQYLHSSPWSGAGWLPVTFYPAVIGLGFLIPVDVVLSCTAFFFWWKALAVLAAAIGVTARPGPFTESVFPFTNEQMFGAYIGIAVIALLNGRRYFAAVGRLLVGRRAQVSDAGEAMSFRLAAVGVGAGFALLVAFSVHAGLGLSVSLAFFLIYLLLSVAVARVRAEFGSPVHDFHFAGPDYTLSRLVGTANLQPRQLGVLSLYWWFNRAYRAHPVPIALEGLQMSARSRLSPRPLAPIIIIAALVALFSATWGALHFAYRAGASTHWPGANYFGSEAFNRLESWLNYPRQASAVVPLAAGAGLATALLLSFLRKAFLGFPLHPVALPIAASWSIHLYWLPMAIAGIVKLLLLRYGGLRLYRAALPLFYGLIAGQAVVGCSWPLAGLLFNVPIYNAFGW